MSLRLKLHLPHEIIEDLTAQDCELETTTEGDPEGQPQTQMTSPSSSDPSSFEVIDTVSE